MYKVKKTMEIAASHRLHFPSSGTEEPLHGHNWLITVYCRSEELDEDGFVTDFLKIEEFLKDRLDHRDLNEVLPVSPTAENLARWICDHVDKCYKVEVRESTGSEASYEE